MAEQRNNIARYYPRAAKLALVRWRDVDGLPPIRVKERARAAWPALPVIHGTTWQHWRASAEYAELLRLVTGEQAERERLSELFQAAGGPEALADVADAAAYALAAKAMRIADGAEDAREVRSLMQTVRDARRQSADQVQEACTARIEALQEQHAAEIATLQATIAGRDEAIAQLTAALQAAGIDPDTEPAQKGGGLSAAALHQIEEQARLL